MNIEMIKNNSIIVTPNILKDKILKSISGDNKLLNINIITREEFIERFTFSYDNSSILYMMDTYKYDLNVCKIMLDNMIYVEDKNYSNKLLNTLVNIKKELLDKGLIKEDRLFSKYLKNKNIYIYGYYYVDKLFSKYLSGFNYEVIDKLNNNYLNNKVYSFSTLEEEVEFVFNKASELINNGIDINKIKIVNYSNKYDNVFKKLGLFYNICFEDIGYSVYSTKIVKEFLELIKSNSFSDTLNIIKSKYNDEDSISIVKVINNICNKYNDLDYSFDSIYKLIINDLKNTKISNNYKNKISFCKMIPEYFDEDDYVFMIGFNQNELPKLYKDEDYISDNIKTLINLEDTAFKNENEKNKIIYFINNIKNLYISYSCKHLSNKYYPSNLIKELGMIEEDIPIFNNSYSVLYNKIKLTKYLDDLIKYGTINKELSNYYNNYEINYMSYSNMFTGLDRNKVLSKLDNKLLLSYSSINTYNKCKFRYYLDNIMKINKYEESFQIKVGNLFHYLLSICFLDNFDLDSEWDKYLSKYELSNKENVLLIKLKEEFIFILEFVKNLHKETGLTNSLMEHKVYIDKKIFAGTVVGNDVVFDKDIPVTFMGIIDKCMSKEKDGEDLISIVDYKTGNPSISLTNCCYGIDMQLPIYWYLVKKGNLFNNPKFVGFYLEKILHGELRRDESKTYKEIKLDNLKLIGYSSTDKSRVERFDPTFENSIFIKSMKLKKDGEYSHYTKVLDDDILDSLVDYIDRIINENIVSILVGEFEINPKQIGSELVGCKYCDYCDICFRSGNDIVKLKEYEDLSFLGGEDNA